MNLKRLWQHLATTDRSRWMTAGGAAALVLSALSPWSAHPSASRSWAESGELVLGEQLFALDLVVRTVTFTVGVLFLALALRSIPLKAWQLRAAWALPAIIVAFPCWLGQFYPERMSERELLYRQMNHVADDMDANLTEQQVDWRGWQAISAEVVDAVPLARVPLRPWYPGTFAPSRAHHLLEEVMGWGPAFLGFVSPRLLVITMGGVVFLLCGLHLRPGPGVLQPGQGLRRAVLILLVLIAIPLGPRLMGEYHLLLGEHTSRRGETSAALSHYRAARFWKPGLSFSWSYYTTLGELTRQQDRLHGLESLLSQAQVLVIQKHPERALEPLREASARYPEEKVVSRFLAIALAESGIHAFNRGQIGLAKDYWTESLAHVPIDPIPWYGLSLVHARRKRYDDAAGSLSQVVRLQEYLGYRRLPVRSQQLVAESWAAFQTGDLSAAHETYGRSVRPESW